MKWQCDNTVAKIKYKNRKISWEKNRFSTPIDWCVCVCSILYFMEIFAEKSNLSVVPTKHIKEQLNVQSSEWKHVINLIIQ